VGAAHAPPRALMLEDRTVAVVVPAYDEEALVATTIQGVPDFVDRILVVDDASSDGTAAAARAVGDERVEVVTHQRNSGVGAAIVTGYQRALAEGVDVVCVMAADNQMDPTDLKKIALPGGRFGGTQEWNGRDDEQRAVPAGLYFARLTCGSLHAQTRVVLLP